MNGRSLHRHGHGTATIAAPAVALAGAAVLPFAHPAGIALLLTAGVLTAAVLIGGRRPVGSTTALLDATARRHSSPAEWQRLLEIEQARTAPERRLLLAREFRRLAEEALAAAPDDRATWPAPGRLMVLGRQANLLLASATDRNAAFLPDPEPDDHLTAAALGEAARCLTGHLALLRAVQLVPDWDLELVRVLTRERTRLALAYERIGELLRDP